MIVTIVYNIQTSNLMGGQGLLLLVKLNNNQFFFFQFLISGIKIEIFDLVLIVVSTCLQYLRGRV